MGGRPMSGTDADKVLSSALEMVPPGIRHVSKANLLIARTVLQEEMGRYGEHPLEYSLQPKTTDTLLVHARQDAAHALLNTASLLEHGAKISTQLRLLNVLAFISVCLLGAIVAKLYPQLLSGLHLQ
jgi:hypothetical protein